jgi:hypothetical protein
MEIKTGGQDKSAVYEIVAFVFDGKDAALQNLKDTEHDGTLKGYKVKVQTVVEQDENGKVHIHESGHGIQGTALKNRVFDDGDTVTVCHGDSDKLAPYPSAKGTLSERRFC